MGVVGLLKDFSGWTSAHGIPQIGSARNAVVRLIWILIYIGFAGMFSYQLYLIISKYFKYGTSVSTNIKFEERVFPAVTICNRNPFKNSAVTSANAPDMKILMDDYKQVLEGATVSAPDKYKFNSQSTAMDKLARARTAMVYASKEISDDKWSTVTYSLDEILLECRFGQAHCNSTTDFESFRDPYFGACYTFNNDAQSPKYTSVRGGSFFGLSLVLRSDQSELLPISEVAAFRVTVHPQNTEPFPDAFGYSASAGQVNNLGVKFGTTIRLQKPYGNCVNKSSEVSPFYYTNSSYSMEACVRSCYQKQIVEKCECSDPRFAVDQSTTVTYCTIDNVDCIEKKVTNITANCECNAPCDDTAFAVTASQSYWPQDTHLAGSTDFDKHCGEKTGSDLATCLAWWKKNTVRVEVFYERLSYQELKANIAYSVTDISTDLGGQLGFWLGWSVITVVEFVGFSLIVCCYCVAKHQGPPAVPDEDEHSQDMDEIDQWMQDEELEEENSNSDYSDDGSVESVD